MLDVVFSAWCLKCGLQSRGRLILTSTSSSLRRGKLQKPVGGNQPAAARKERRDGMLIPEGNARGDGSSLRILGNPRKPTRFFGARAQQQNKGGGRGGGKIAFKPGLPSEGADNKEAAKVW